MTKYLELLLDNIKGYKKATDEERTNAKQQDIIIAKELRLGDRIMKTAEKQAFLTLKDHKNNFMNHPSCRFVNPTKPEIG